MRPQLMPQTRSLHLRPVTALSSPVATPSATFPTTTTRSFSSAPESKSFKAETRSLLEIVTNSIYTTKQIFLRELVSNCSDSLSKLQHVTATESLSDFTESELRIDIDINKDEKTLTIKDNGIGMTAGDLESNLGTIAKSGSADFKATEDSGDVIGKFGVGFYSAFMVGDHVTVKSRSVKGGGDAAAGGTWSSDGGGEFYVTEDGLESNGCEVKIKLKEGEEEYMEESRIKSVLKEYSNFINYPIYLNGEKVNTQKALWTEMPSSVKADEHEKFYQYISNGFDKPLHTLHYRADAPLDIKTLLYIPSYHTEKYGMGRMTAGVSLYCRKVLIEKESDVLPEWLRFVKGVVDCEDLPLNIGRESSSDNLVKNKLKEAVKRRVVSELEKIKKKGGDKWSAFWKEYGSFLKEGVCQDYSSQAKLSKLLMWESSKDGGELVNFDDYISRCPPEQKDIYYLTAPNREAADASPYKEGRDEEVIYVFSAIDDFVMANLGEYEGRKIVSLEKSGEEEEAAEGGEEIIGYIKQVLGESKVSKVEKTSRLKSTPAIVTDHESGAMRRMMKMVDTQGGATGTMNDDLPPLSLKVNVEHPILVGAKEVGGEVGDKVIEQVFENAIVGAGLREDGRAGVERVNWLLEKLVQSEAEKK
ncbi:hypothetical protein TrST_g6818 [Triparma strigata]|uniref:Heat shock protein 90 n=1 Tax=Triparma strigata TaxID=1606541 RepID=A0A9W7AMG8_9STRA|nr:hypothetical protein TrST_g6818 [Triparma strigata]